MALLPPRSRKDVAARLGAALLGPGAPPRLEGGAAAAARLFDFLAPLVEAPGDGEEEPDDEVRRRLYYACCAALCRAALRCAVAGLCCLFVLP